MFSDQSGEHGKQLPEPVTDREEGRARSSEWKGLAPLLEARGLPKFDALMGGRYVPAVDWQYGLAESGHAPVAPDGKVDWASWKRRKPRSRRKLPASE